MENREETNGRQNFRKDTTSRSVPKSQHDSPSPEGSLIQLLAGLLALASSDWPPSRSRRARSVALIASPPRLQWRGRSRFRPGSQLYIQKYRKQHQKFFILFTNEFTEGMFSLMVILRIYIQPY